MWDNGPWDWFPIMMIFPIIFLVIVVYFLARLTGLTTRGTRINPDKEPSPKEILDLRYARGEISREEYQKMKEELRS